MNNCKDCKHSIFDELWGEYKCKVLKRRVYILLDKDECPNYEKKKRRNRMREELNE